MSIPWQQECEEMSMKPYQAPPSTLAQQFFPENKLPSSSFYNYKSLSSLNLIKLKKRI